LRDLGQASRREQRSGGEQRADVDRRRLPISSQERQG
jgi:hypothetical protein